MQRQSALFFSPGDAARLYGHPGQADAIGVLLRQGADVNPVLTGVRRVVSGTGLVTYTGRDRGEAEFLDVSQTRQTLLAMSLPNEAAARPDAQEPNIVQSHNLSQPTFRRQVI